MRAEIISIGTELLLGSITDTNASYLAQRLAAAGVDCYYISQVGDNLERLTKTLARAWERSDLVITTGGLGPTQDDLTREAIAALLSEEMKPIPELETELRARFAQRGVEMPPSNIKQATLVPSASAIENPVGTAPGWWVKRQSGQGTKQIVSMPGVPFEMRRMWEREVEPRLQAQSGFKILSRTLKVLGYGESAVEAKVVDLMSGTNPSLAPYAKQDGIHLRITAKVQNEDEGEILVRSLENQVRERLGDAIYGVNDESPWDATAAILNRLRLSLALLEVGITTAGALGPLVTATGDSQYGRCLGYLSLGQLQDTGISITGRETSGTLDDAISAWRDKTGADLALGIWTEVARQGGLEASVVHASTSLVVLGPGREPDGTGLIRSNHAWRTASSEVKRLVGLAACNMLRLRLLELESRAEN
jgi:nicotinamide-nucleotide amidase